MSRKTTLQQVAEAAGVSLSTVDRVLNQRGGVNPKKQAKVLEWAHRLNIDRTLFRSYMPILRVAVLMQSPKNPFYKGLCDAFTDASTQLPERRIHFFLHYLDVNDTAKTVEQVMQIPKSYDALVVISPQCDALVHVLRKIANLIPILTLATDIPNCGRIAYIGPDNRQMGRTAGELMGRFMGSQGGDVVIVLGLNEFIGQGEREIGFRNVLRERFPQCSVTRCLESEENSIKAGEMVRDVLRKEPSIRGIYNVTSGNSQIASALQIMGLHNAVTLITHELSDRRIQMLREGVIDAILDQNPQLEVRRVMDILSDHFKRDKIQIPIDGFTRFDIYIRENCPQY
ncbi:LacI family DNA-binding transcriptional regulator [Providencia rettgeri]|nr:LacI family DNA-binding transcriptional regulator [Providencia rettgeri]